jgi:molybdopterin converting factor small subunit
MAADHPDETPGVEVVLTRALVDLFPGLPPRVALQAADVRALIHELDRRWPGVRDRLCDSTPRIRRHLNIFVDGQKATLATQLQPGAKVFVLTAMSGG